VREEEKRRAMRKPKRTADDARICNQCASIYFKGDERIGSEERKICAYCAFDASDSTPWRKYKEMFDPYNEKKLPDIPVRGTRYPFPPGDERRSRKGFP
jgi:hypothetical protein